MTALVVAVAYVLGTFPSALLIGRRAGFDPTVDGSRNPGASNVFRLGGRAPGALVLAVDAGKGMLAAWLGLAVGGAPLALVAGLAAVLGHVIPVTRPGRGGKGVATALGVRSSSLAPAVGAVAIVVWLLTAVLTRTASVASVAAMVVAAGLTVLSGRPGREVICVLAIAVVVVGRHRGNLARWWLAGRRSCRSVLDATRPDDS